MPCCQSVLSAAAAAASSTPSWLHRLHAKEGLSFPSHLNIDDLLYGGHRPQTLQLPPPPPSTSNHQASTAIVSWEPPPKAAKPKQQQQRPPRNPSRPNPSSTDSPQPQSQLTAVISDVFAIPSSDPTDTLALKAFRKQSRPRPRTDGQADPARLPGPRKDKKDKSDKIAKTKKRRRAERAGEGDGEKCTRIDVTVIDTSTSGWKAAKVLIRRGDVWKLRDKKPIVVSEHEDAIAKGKRRAGLVSKLQRDKEKERQKFLLAASSVNIDACSAIVLKESDDPPFEL